MQISSLKEDNGELTVDKREIAEMLKKQFSSIFDKEDVGTLPDFKIRTNSYLGPEKILEKINEEEIERRLKRLKKYKSTGPDRIHPKILLECASAFAKPLTIIFRKSIKEKKISKTWKMAQRIYEDL